ncbi:outer membrane lipoprotein chaperone LolA [Vibrio rumoiensis]|uniref:Outer-membrane lipoprotein carrier protein n=1 Tax=Vibrio rumoiensis 1S-45 TaxID=1188252 RepID=A0A1E5E3I6_9VIBR|nr:outer membrane lipoprotein chaperone LolA [Vibrio rumoiensis]OEF26904.1 outer membrane lipoprotein carrier protein LolA [Vibrio rumoiensis 1S-45]
MKKCLLVLLFASASVFAGPKEELNTRLNHNEGFSADFTQKVTSPEGEVLLDGKGSAQISRPSLFRWKTSAPDETLLVSDGKSVWYYSPFVEQVTILNQEQATAQTPFVLLTRNRASDWANYNVTQSDDTFTLKPTATDTTIGTFQIKINDKGVVQAFNVIEQDGQQSRFAFTNFKMQKPDASLFTFKVPKGVEVDDQRQ